MPDEVRWTQFNIRVYADAAEGDAKRVVFEPRGQIAAGHQAHPATVVLRAGGELIVKYSPPDPEIAGFTRDDFVDKAAATLRWMAGTSGS